MRWGKRPSRRTADDGARGPLDDWLVIPVKYAEPARVSLWNLANRPDMPTHIAAEIATWLQQYNMGLTHYFSDTYGEDVFEDLKEITLAVQASSNPWEAWEEQFRG